MRRNNLFPLRNTFSQAGRSKKRRPSANLASKLKIEHLETRVVPANVDVLQYHYDHNLSGWDSQETDLNLTNVNQNTFGKLFSQPVDGYVYASVLYKANLTIGGAVHNVAFVSTEHDSIYAFDADSNQGASANPLWKRSFINPAAGVTTVPQPEVISGDIVPEIGITGAPVIDPATNTMYVVVKTKEVVSSVTHYVQKLHAVDITTGNDRATNGVVTIGDTTIGGPDGGYTDNTPIVVPGAGAGHDTTNMVRFNALRENNRSSLVLVNGNVYIAFASHGDNGPYHGWVLGYRASDLSLQQFFNTSPNAGAGGIWQSGGGVAADAAGNLYFATGNTFQGPQPGFSPANGNYGETVLKLSTTGQLTAADYFTPFNWLQLDGGDQDLGSGGTMLLPDSVGSPQHQHLMVETGKSGVIYLIDRDNMGHNVPAPGPDNVVQTLSTGIAGVWGNPSFYQVNPTTGYIYYHGSGSQIIAVQISAAHMTGVVARGAQTFGFPGGQPIISSNGAGANNAIAWDLKTDNYGSTTQTATLYAYNALTLATLYSSDQVGLRDRVGGSVKFTAATVSNGHVFVGSQTSFDVFGLFPTHATVPTAPTGLAAQGLTGSTISLTWMNPTPNLANYIQIERSTDGTNFSVVAAVGRFDTSYTDTGLQPGTNYTYRIRATNELGNSPYSNTATGATRIAAPVLAASNVTRTEIDISWSPSGNDHYLVERSFNGGAFTTVADNLPPTQTSFNDTTATQQGSYRYRVTAFNHNPADMATSNVITVSNQPAMISHGPPGGFTDYSDLMANGSTHFVSPLIQLTDGGFSEAGTAFGLQRLNISTFDTTFDFRVHEGTNPRADGLSFIIQGNGPTALGPGGGGLGYGPDHITTDRGIRNSVAIKFDFFDNAGEGPNSTGLFTDGRSPTNREPGLPADVPDISIPVDPNVINFNDQHTKHVHLTYDGTTLHESIVDLTTMTTFSHDYQVDLNRWIGTNTAYVGFGAGTGGLSSIQDILNWVFTPGQGVPGAPTNLTVTSIGTNDVNLTWHSNSINETGFIVERAANGSGNYIEVGRTDSPRFHDTNLPPGYYTYRVRAYNDAGSSGNTNVVSAVIGPTSPFTDHSAGFATHTDLTANGNAAFPNGLLRLTDGGGGEASSVWTNTRVGVFSWSTSFVLRDQNVQGSADGVTFALQANSPTALGGGGGAVGYDGIRNSVAVIFDLYSSGSHRSGTELFMNGNTSRTGEIDMGPAGIVLGSGHPFLINLAYDGVQLALTESVTDTVTGAVFRQVYNNVNIPQIIGSNTAFAGFTGGTGGETAIQDISSWSARFLDPVQPVNHLATASATTVVAGNTLSVTVTAKDGFNNTKTDYRGTVHITSTDPQFQPPLDYTFTAADNGVHTFNFVLRTAGTQSVTLTDTATGYITGTDTVTVTPAAASLFVIAGFPTSVVAGTEGTFTVTAQDPYGNTATGYTGTVTFSSTDPQADLPAPTTLTNGTGTFTATLKTAGTQSISGSDGTISGSQGGITVTPAAATVFQVVGFASPTNAGDIHTFVVTAKDPYGNTDPTFRGTVHFSSTDPQADLEPDYTFTAADQGVHVSGAVLFTAGLQSIVATTSNGQIVGSQDNILVVALAADHLVVSGYPSPVRPGVPSIITVTAQDRYGNTAPTYLGTIHFTTSDPNGFVPPDYTFQPGDNGVHQFAAVLVTPGFQTITATDTSDGTILGTQTIQVVLPATHLVLSAPANAVPGVPFQVTVSAVAADGNVDPLYTGTIHFSSTDDLAGLPADYTFSAADGGAAVFTITLNTTGIQTVVVQDTVDDTLFDSADIDVEAGGSPGVPGGQGGSLWQAFITPTAAPAAVQTAVTQPAEVTAAPAPDQADPVSGAALAQAYRANRAGQNPAIPDLIDLVLSDWAVRNDILAPAV